MRRYGKRQAFFSFFLLSFCGAYRRRKSGGKIIKGGYYIYQLSTQTGFSAGVYIVENCQKDNRCPNHVLMMGTQVHQYHSVVYGTHYQAPDNNADYCANAATG
jgi:hypothetical protein